MVNERITIINAPAGSGKTTEIENEVKSKVLDNQKKILCLTYTNRAVDELKSRINHKSVDICTIHSFLQRETKLIFSKPEIIDLYIRIFNDKLVEQLSDETKSTKYKSKFDVDDETQVNIDQVRANISKIIYNERNYSSYLYGAISHDDLLYFVYIINKKFDYFKMKLNGIYSIIYLDEYQDTDKYFIDFLKEIVEFTNSKILLNIYGDNMQKIYGLGNKLEGIKAIEKRINKNHRSSNQLIRLFNAIYNQVEYEVEEKKDNQYEDFTPTIEIYHRDRKYLNIKEDSFMNLSSKYDEIFSIIIGNSVIYNVFSKLKQNDYTIYGYTAELNASSLLMNIDDWDNDILLSHLKIIFYLHTAYTNKEYGKLINEIRHNKTLNNSVVKIEIHEDREKVSTLIRELFNEMDNEISYKDFLDKYKVIFKKDIINELDESNIDYEDYIDKIKIGDVHALYKYLISDSKEYDISTQHGVKGESHHNVNLICEDNTRSKIDYKLFFEYFTKHDIDIITLEKEYDYLLAEKDKLFDILNITKSEELKANLFKNNLEVIENFKTNIEKRSLKYSRLFIGEINISNVTNFKKVFSYITRYEKYIITFKIFYVGCSRAREKLIVKVNEDYIKEYETEFKNKMRNLGFHFNESKDI